MYEKQKVTVRDAEGDFQTVMTYAMTRERDRVPAMPSEVYYNRIRDGYRQNRLPLKALDAAVQNLRDEVRERQGEIFLPGSPKPEDVESRPKKSLWKRKRRER